jgi:hypothetical protein
MIYLPLLLTVVLFIVDAVICRHGNVPVFDRLLGPLTCIAFGWTSIGAGIWDLSRGSGRVIQSDSNQGHSRSARWAEALLPVVFGAALVAMGLWLLLRRR